MFTICELYIWSRDLNTDFILKDRLFKAVELTENADPNKFSYSEYGIDFSKNVIIFVVYNSSSAHTGNRKKDISVLGKSPAQGLDNTAVTAEAKYSFNCNNWKTFFV